MLKKVPDFVVPVDHVQACACHCKSATRVFSLTHIFLTHKEAPSYSGSPGFFKSLSNYSSQGPHKVQNQFMDLFRLA